VWLVQRTPRFSNSQKEFAKANDSSEARNGLRHDSVGTQLKVTRSAAVLSTNIASLDRYQTPIEFYGRVLDENERPVQGAIVEFSWSDRSADGQSTRRTTSDSNGSFALKGVQGKGLDVRIQNTGYYSAPSNPISFEYFDRTERDFHQPSKANPVVFRLRKQGVGAELITSAYGVSPDLYVKAPRNGEIVWVDLLARKVGSAGQLEISHVKPDLEHWREATEWSFRLSLPDGGLVEQNDDFPFEAPEEGYEPVVEFQFHREDANWTTILQKRYYIAFGRPRRYGRLEVETALERGIRIQYAINPTGSRNLEPAKSAPSQVGFYE
jgi:hypothetical protein